MEQIVTLQQQLQNQLAKIGQVIQIEDDLHIENLELDQVHLVGNLFFLLGLIRGARKCTTQKQ